MNYKQRQPRLLASSQKPLGSPVTLPPTYSNTGLVWPKRRAKISKTPAKKRGEHAREGARKDRTWLMRPSAVAALMASSSANTVTCRKDPEFTSNDRLRAN